MKLNAALNHASHDADAEKVGVVEGSFSVNLVRKVTEDVGIGELYDKLKDDILTPHLTIIGPVRTLTPTGFRNLMFLWKTAGFMNRDSRKGGEVEEVFKRVEGV